MRQVFVTKCGAAWEVIDKSTGEVIDVIDDVLIFNGIYKRHKNKCGWHGILSEEINFAIIEFIKKDYLNPSRIDCKDKPYYPRLNGAPIKEAGYVHFKNNDVYISCAYLTIKPFRMKELCSKWKNNIIDEEGEETWEEWPEFNIIEEDEDDDY